MHKLQPLSLLFQFSCQILSVLGRGMNCEIPSVMDIEKCPGFGFVPDERLLIDYFLAGKNSGQAEETWPILEIDLCEFEPFELIDLQTAGCDNYKYFFHRRKYANERNKSYKRRTKTGYWKPTGRPRYIKGGGTKRSLSFYRKNSVRGSKAVLTGLIIQEYDNGGEYVIAKLQIKYDKNKNKLRDQIASRGRNVQNVFTDGFTEDIQTVSHDTNGFPKDIQTVSHDTTAQIVSTYGFLKNIQIVSHDTEMQIVLTDGFICHIQTVSHDTEDQIVSTDGFSKDIQTVSHDAEVQNVPTDDYMEDNQILSRYSEDLPSFEDQNLNEMTAVGSDLEHYHQNTANYPTFHLMDQNRQDMDISDTARTIWEEGFRSETENQSSNNESEGEWSPLAYTSFPDEAPFIGEVIFSPYSVVPTTQNELPAVNLDQSDWWKAIYMFFK